MRPTFLPRRVALGMAALFLSQVLIAAEPAGSLEKGRELTKARKFQAAIKEFDAVIAATPTSAEAFLERGRVFSEMGKTDRPLGDFDEALRLKPNYAEAWFEHGRVRARNYEHQKAVGDFTNALRLNPDFIPALLERGKSHHRLQHYAAARKDFSKVIALDGKLAEAWFLRGNSARSGDDPRLALKDLETAIALDPSHAEWIAARGGVFAWLGQPERAFEDFAEALRMDPTLADCYYDRARLYTDQGKIDLAIADYTEAIRYMGQVGSFYLERAKLKERKGLRKEALADTADAKQRAGPKNWSLLFDCGYFYGQLGEHQKALATYNEAIRRNPAFSMALANRANELEALGRTEEAHADRLAAVKLDPQNVYARNALGAEHHKKGEYERAIEEYTAAIDADPKFHHAIYNRFLSHCVLGRLDAAVTDASRYLAVHGWAGEEAMYCALVRSVVARRAEGDGPATTLLSEAAAKCDRGTWPHPILRHLNGELSLDELLRLSDNTEKMTESRGYVGLILSAAGQREQALPHLRWVRNEGKKTLTEYQLAMAELKRLKE